MTWAIAIVAGGQERSLHNLISEEQKLECWYPVGITLTKPKRKHSPVQVIHPVFSGYLFVTYHPNTLNSLLSDPKYSALMGYLSFEGRMYPIEDEIVVDLKRREAIGEFDELLAKMKEHKSFHKGSKVLISNSVLGPHINGKIGIVLRDCINKTQVLVEVNGLKINLAVAFAEEIS